jgi:hypothetical protein
MPWTIHQDDGRYCVHNKEGKRLKCYDTQAEAQSYMRALYANEGKSLEGIDVFFGDAVKRLGGNRTSGLTSGPTRSPSCSSTARMRRWVRAGSAAAP